MDRLTEIIKSFETMPREKFAKEVIVKLGIKYEFSKLVVADNPETDLLSADWATLITDFKELGVNPSDLTKTELQSLVKFIFKKALHF